MLELPPLVETERLVLRPWKPDDAVQLREALAESVAHLLPWIPWATAEPPTQEQTEALLETWLEQRRSGANIIYAAFDAATGRLVGGIGLYARVGPGALEIGYWLRTSEAGRGLATEATRALTAAGFSLADVETLEIHTDPDNRPSRRVPEKLGYTLVEVRRSEGDGGGPARTTVVYALRRDAFARSMAGG